MDKIHGTAVSIKFLPATKKRFECLISVMKSNKKKYGNNRRVIKYHKDKLIATNMHSLCCLHLDNIVKERNGDFKQGALYMPALTDEAIYFFELTDREEKSFPDVLKVMDKQFKKYTERNVNYTNSASSFNSFLTKISPDHITYDYTLVKPFIKAISHHAIDVSFQKELCKLETSNMEFYIMGIMDRLKQEG